MEDFNERIDNLIDYLNVKTQRQNEDEYYFLTEEGAQSRLTVIQRVREILGADEKCFNCKKYKFKFELSVVEGTDKKVCQDCAEGILDGSVKLQEEI